MVRRQNVRWRGARAEAAAASRAEGVETERVLTPRSQSLRAAASRLARARHWRSNCACALTPAAARCAVCASSPRTCASSWPVDARSSAMRQASRCIPSRRAARCSSGASPRGPSHTRRCARSGLQHAKACTHWRCQGHAAHSRSAILACAAQVLTFLRKVRRRACGEARAKRRRPTAFAGLGSKQRALQPSCSAALSTSSRRASMGSVDRSIGGCSCRSHTPHGPGRLWRTRAGQHAPKVRAARQPQVPPLPPGRRRPRAPMGQQGGERTQQFTGRHACSLGASHPPAAGWAQQETWEQVAGRPRQHGRRRRVARLWLPAAEQPLHHGVAAAAPSHTACCSDGPCCSVLHGGAPRHPGLSRSHRLGAAACGGATCVHRAARGTWGCRGCASSSGGRTRTCSGATPSPARCCAASACCGQTSECCLGLRIPRMPGVQGRETMDPHSSMGSVVCC